MRPRQVLAVLAASVIVVVTGCAATPGATTTVASTSSTTASVAAATPDPSAVVAGDLTVYAAASLRGAFDELATKFAAANPGVNVRPIVYDGSATLATQIVAGAPVDVFAAADEANMAKVTGEDLARNPSVFATNTLVIAVPMGNPRGVTTVADLGDVDAAVVLCAPEVPCGAASRSLLERAGVSVTPVSIEQNVTAVLTKVRTGEADAGLVYTTDVRGADDVEAIVAAEADRVVNRYPIVDLTGAGNPVAAAAFTAFVLGEQGQAVLADFGFGAP